MSQLTPGVDALGDSTVPVPEPSRGAPPRGRRERRDFIRSNLVAAAGTWIAGLLGLLLQALISHHVRPAVYGEVFAVFTFFTLLTQPAAAVSRLVTWTTSRERAATRSSEAPESDALLRLTNQRMLVGGFAIALVSLALSPTLAHVLGVPELYVLLSVIGVPFLFATAPLLAAFQGRQRWMSWSALSIGIALSRIVFVFAFLLLLGPIGILLGISIAAAVIYVIALALVWPRIRAASSTSSWLRHWRFLVISVGSTLMSGVLLGSDVIMVQHFYRGPLAGQFSSAAVTSRSLFFAFGSVSSVLLPVVAARHMRGRSARNVVLLSLAFAIVGGAVGLAVFDLGGASILHVFSGKAYVAGSSFIGWYALGMPLLAAVLMLSSTQQSLGSLRLLWVLVPGTIIKPALLFFFHDSLLEVAIVSDVAIASVLVALTTMYLVGERRWIQSARAQRLPVPERLEPQPPPLPGPPVLRPEQVPAFPAPPPPPPPLVPRPGWVAGLRGLRPHPVAWATAAVKAPGAWASATLQEISAAPGWRARVGVILDHPPLVIVGLAIISLAIRHAWFSALPLSAGDWHYPDTQRLLSWSPWPSVWDNTLGMGGENRFVEAFRFPVFAVSGLLAQLGATWTFVEKFIYFIPFAIILPVAGWLLSREVLGRTRWALLTPLLLIGNTYFMLESDGEIPLALAEAISFLALFAFLRCMRRRSMGWALLTGLLVALTTAFDIRPAFLSVVLMAMYFVTLLVVEHDWITIKRRVLLGAVAGTVYIGTQAYWLLPLITYHGNPGFPTPTAPDFNILTLGHGLTGVSAFWTGSQTAFLVQAPLNPAYMILPLIALAPLLAKRLRPEILWLAVAALLFAFFTKTNNPPLGGVYEWMYSHVPGWKLFREGSKFLYVVGLAYSILIPAALRTAFSSSARWRQIPRQFWVRAGSLAALAGVTSLCVLSVVVLQSGALQSTTVPTPEPQSFSDFSTVLAADAHPGSVLWFGQALIGSGQRNHHFLVTSPTHPAVNLTGKFNNTKINQRDPFQLYCANNLVPYCYVDSQLFPYLAQVSGAGYIVVPGGNQVGTIPKGVSRQWLRTQMTSMFGAPHRLGSGATELDVWKIAAASTVTVAPGVAVVDAGPWATTGALPALQAMGLPSVYRQTYYQNQYPVAPANLPDSVRVLPRLGGSCIGSSGGSVGIMAQSTAASLGVTVGGAAQTLPLLNTPIRLAGWSVYGPTEVGAGQPLTATAANVVLGPCVVWSPLAATALAPHSSNVPPLNYTWHGERLTTTASRTQPWVLLRRYYDPGWRLEGAKALAAGDGLFNLYHVKQTGAGTRNLTFTFNTLPWEEIGQVVALLAAITAVVIAVVELRRRPSVEVALPRALAPSPAARLVAAGGIFMVAATAGAVAAGWFGVFSTTPAIGYASDPYGLDVGYGGAALALLLASVVLRVAAHLRSSSKGAEERRKPSVAPRLAAAAMTLVMGLVVSACGESISSYQDLINQAQDAGSVAPSVVGETLDDARLQRAAKDAPLCIADYTQALHLFNDLASAYAGRAACYLNGGLDAPAAVQDYTEALSLQPLRPDLYLGRAVAYRVSGNQSAAIGDYITAGQNGAANASAQLSAVDGLLAMFDIGDAQKMYSLASARNPDDPVLHVAAADIAIARSHDAEADDQLIRAEQLATKSRSATATVLAHVCHLEVLRHQVALAVTDCRGSVAASKSGSGAYDDLSAAQLEAGDLPGALTSINNSIEAFIGNVGPYAQEAGVDGFGLANLYTAKAWIQLQLHDRAGALKTFQRAVQALPNAAPDARARLKAFEATARAD